MANVFCIFITINCCEWSDLDRISDNLYGGIQRGFNSQPPGKVSRSAVSKGAVNGVFIGAIPTGKRNSFGWIDGSDWDYENFYPGFPVAELGDCHAIDTLSGSGEWMNVDCSSKIAVVCARPGMNAPRGPGDKNRLYSCSRQIRVAIVWYSRMRHSEENSSRMLLESYRTRFTRQNRLTS
ncbi:hypothetical protein PENTCL1PPCAC_12788 [Pristionchus entomophagus]|uniref:C-type lectin domain-containing protein n=1 Tax=Pristionchus entomophagus TaxID=358040 RepID=A0AAV5TCV3_9BILA|nr:hypothetical protein PENTCL1PPCAC_12788 [Pristionchus entomophagus]